MPKREAAAEEPRREGQEAGGPEVRLDPERRRLYHVNAAGERVYHDCPAGFTYDDAGALVRTEG